ncbi:pro-epidermal growth factor [Periophthalmus magnuspinnatus]|uniref:pro-epidermal growth factor n=1 Tax=Periophthalmus magnuspinnatus TaxID=409849 RepID=UPI002436B27D|nr:pro-epidermal growth factor [Periophthalmus magnuspinnatus]
MLAALVTTLICFILQSSLTHGRVCWEESMVPKGRNSSCVAPQAFLIFGHGKAIHRMQLDGKRQRRLVAGVGTSIIIDFDYREETVYWADRYTGLIYKAQLGAHKQKVFSSDKHISGLAVDWLLNSIYWTSGVKGKIRKIDMNGKNEKTILRHLTQPASIAVDPTKRFLFWLSGETSSSIQRANLTGHMKTTLIKINGQLKVLSVDHKDKRLFWVQFGPDEQSAIGSCDYSGKVIHITDHQLRSFSLGIAIFKNNLYYNDFESHGIKRVNKYGGDYQKVNRKALAKPPVDIKVVQKQPTEDSILQFSSCDKLSGNCVNVCSSPSEDEVCQCSEGFVLSKQGTYCEDVNECAHWNHGCSLGCENIPGSYFCTCPKGYTLMPDKKTCQEIIECDSSRQCGSGCLEVGGSVECVCPEGSVLQEDGQACTGCTSADRGGCSQLCSPLNSSVSSGQWQCGCVPGYELQLDRRQCIAEGPPPLLLVATLVDVRKVCPDGTGEEILLSESTGRITALDYDPVHKEVYYVSMSRRSIERVSVEDGSRHTVLSERVESVQGLTIDWLHRTLYWTEQSQSTIECSPLTGLRRETVISDGLQKPKAIAVHPLVKRLFWTDVGSRPMVDSASLDGGGRVVVVSTNLISPSALSLDFPEERLWWADSGTGLVESAQLDGSLRHTLSGKQVAQVFGLAVWEERLWVSEQEHHQLRSFHKRTGKELEHLHSNMVQPANIVVLHPVAKPGADVCLHKNGGCAQLCESNLGTALCSCLPHYTLSADGTNCHQGETVTSPRENQTHSEESTTVITEVVSATERIDLVSSAGTTSSLSDKMVADEHECSSLHCDDNAQCVQTAGGSVCVCREGFTGNGHLCMDIDECEAVPDICDPNAECVNTVGSVLCRCHTGFIEDGTKCKAVVTVPPVISSMTPGHHNNNVVERCPSSHESYCLYQGVCFYFPDMDSYACNCMSGYMGERCQFSDLEWWELQQAEEQKKKNVTIAGCMVGLISLLSIAACVTYCYGTRKLFAKKLPDDHMSETSGTVESMSVTTTSSAPPFSMTTERELHTIMGCPRRAVCPSCSSEPGDNSEDSELYAKHNRGYECSMLSAVAMETDQLPDCQSSPVSTFSTFKPHQQPQSLQPPAS